MSRPSRNIDQLLIATARELLPETGCRGFSIRQLTDQAGVNLGMFHYHFKTRDHFLSLVLRGVYEEMLTSLTFQAHADRPPVDNLRAALNVLGRFARDNRFLVRRLLADALSGEAVAQEFFRVNFPLHVKVLAELLVLGQRAGVLRKLPVLQALTFLGGAIAFPNIMVTALEEQKMIPPTLLAHLGEDVLSDKAIAQRVDMAVRGLQTDKETVHA
ncbi:MAG: TetR/AcrR family transcriptional regulator [Candidatus Binatia bacterium]